MYKLKCSCGKYETAHELTIGTADFAANMHIMLPGLHEVSCITRSGLSEVIATNKEKVHVD